MWNNFLCLLLVLGLIGGGLPLTVYAQEDPSQPRSWEASVRLGYDRVSDGRADWLRWTAALQRTLPGGALRASVLHQRRFGTSDRAATVGLWQNLWSDAYGHLQLGIAPGADIRPRRQLVADLFQPIGDWEVSAHFRRQHYPTDNVHMMGPGLGRYVGQWYVRTRTTLVPRQTTWALTQRLGVRRYYRTAPSRSYVDLEVGFGRSVVLVNAVDLLATQTSFGTLRVRHFFTPHLGLTAALRYSNEAVFSRAGGAIGLVGRW